MNVVAPAAPVAEAAATAPWPTAIAGGLAVLLVGLIGATVRAILRGDLVPRSVLTAAEQRSDKWEAAWREERGRADAIDGRLQAIAETSDLSVDLLSQLVERGRR